jgi:hypothetical protein
MSMTVLILAALGTTLPCVLVSAGDARTRARRQLT